MEQEHPTPETTVAFLPSAGLGYRRATKHFYDHTLAKPGLTRTDHAFYFRCSETGALRVWGVE